MSGRTRNLSQLRWHVRFVEYAAIRRQTVPSTERCNSKSRIRVHSIFITLNVHRHMSNVAWQTVWETNWELFEEDVREEATTFASVHGWWHHTTKTRPSAHIMALSDGRNENRDTGLSYVEKAWRQKYAEPSTVTTYLRHWLKLSQLVWQHSPWSHDGRFGKTVPEIFLKHHFQWISTADCLNPPASTQMLTEVTTIRWRICWWWWSGLMIEVERKSTKQKWSIMIMIHIT